MLRTILVVSSLLMMLPVMASPRVVVSILPLHSLAAGVMAGVGAPELLVKGGASPHDFTLRPSDARKLSRADLVVWVGPELEGFLAKPLATLGAGARRLTLAEAAGVRRLPARRGGAWGEAHDHDRHDHEAQAERFDPHLWLDPNNARAAAAALAEALAEVDPTNAERYRANARSLDERLVALDRRLAESLAPLAGHPYLLFHDAFHYFEAHYGLNAIGALTVSPERPPGARRVSEMRRLVREAGALCVFSEPQFRPGLLAAVTEGSGARGGVLDPLGAALAPGDEAYFLLLEGIAEGLRGCLPGPEGR